VQKDPIPAETITIIADAIRRHAAPEIDHRIPVVGLLDQPAELAVHLRARLAADWPEAEVRVVDPGDAADVAGLRDLWLVWASPAGALSISSSLEQAAPLAWLLVVGDHGERVSYGPVTRAVRDTETASTQLRVLVRVLVDHREQAGDALVKERVAARLARDYGPQAIRAAGLELPPRRAPRTFAEEEPVVLEQLLAATGGNRTRAAEIYGVTPKTLRALLVRYQLSVPGKK
jgi:hypothetical protein